MAVSLIIESVLIIENPDNWNLRRESVRYTLDAAKNRFAFRDNN